MPQSGGREDILGRTHLLHRVGGEAHPNGVADALTQQAADADGGFQYPHPGRTRLCDSQMQGVIRLSAQQLIGRHVHRHTGALHGDADVVEIAVVQQADMAHGTLHQRLRGDAAVFLQQFPLQ